MDVKDFYYELPPELIAQDPLADRSSSRLLVVDKKTGRTEHRIFRDIADYLQPGDCLVINDTKVIPARLFGVKADTQAKIEVLLLKRQENNIWETLVKPGRKCKPGTEIVFGDGLLKGTVLDVADDGNRLIRFTYEGIFEEILDQLGQMPLPPYITHQLKDKNRYQTVYARHDGSAAAPTAGLHFTQELLQQIQDMGVIIARVTLHVGLGTFRPVKVEEIADHHMHSEFYMVGEEAAKKINDTRAAGGRIICVGTTSCRTIESAAGEDGMLKAGSGWTDIFIYPGYQFKLMDCLITNFHLPESTLVMLVSALAGREQVLHAYQEAIDRKYRFFSFGDACFFTDLKGSMTMEQVRLNKYLSEQGICSRREADRLIEAGKVTVDGHIAAMGEKVTGRERIFCNGKSVGRAAGGKIKPVLLIVNKPRGVVCTTSDKDRAPNVVDLLKYPVRVYPVGRLDKDSEGLLLMTNQGELANRMIHAGNMHEKEYYVTVDRPFHSGFIKKMQNGVELKELKVTTRPCEIEAIGPKTFRIVLTQGLNRQIRRMCEELGYHVVTLKRVRIMNLHLGKLKTGDFRRVTPKELEELEYQLEITRPEGAES